ncbi:MAG: hypothetical protein ACRDNZ_04460 [Streptosporangiaceae bacterium]
MVGQFAQADVSTDTACRGNPVVLGRRGRVHVSRDADGQVWVGGGTLTCVTGTAEL